MPPEAFHGLSWHSSVSEGVSGIPSGQQVLRTKLGQRLEEQVSWRGAFKNKDMLHENGPRSMCENLQAREEWHDVCRLTS